MNCIDKCCVETSNSQRVTGQILFLKVRRDNSDSVFYVT